jgi:hypothetical protein
MSEKDVLNDLQQIDSLLARCVNPALTRADHDGIKNIIEFVVQRVRLSYRLEAEKADADKEKSNTNENEA